MSDTIAAISSPPGRGAVGVIRISGAQVPEIATAILDRLPTPRQALLARFLDASGCSLDQGLALYFPAPASFTGEAVLELQGHGGPLVMDLVMQRVLELGCRMARPGEFSERAFLNGKMDMAQAEAVADLIDAGTAAAARAAVRSLQGEFSVHIHDLKARLTGLRMYVEAAIDFPDEELDFLSDTAVTERSEALFASFRRLLASARQGALLRDGLTVVIAGRPNAGKSSLLNRLAGDDVAIVSDLPGTTRDVLRQYLQLDGMPVHVVDTAGLRIATDAVEAEGIRRAQAEMQRADRILYLVDATDAEAATARRPVELDGLPTSIPVTLVINKIDLLAVSSRDMELVDPSPAKADGRVHVSALTGEGVDRLREHLKTCAGYGEPAGGAISARRRHLDALDRAHALLESAVATLRETGAVELFAEDLRLAQLALSEITGEFTNEDLLGEIFGSFCIGK